MKESKLFTFEKLLLKLEHNKKRTRGISPMCTFFY